MSTLNPALGWDVKQLGTARPYSCQQLEATQTQHVTKKNSRKRGCSRIFKACFLFCKKRHVDSDSEDTPKQSDSTESMLPQAKHELLHISSQENTAYTLDDRRTDDTLSKPYQQKNIVTNHDVISPVPKAWNKHLTVLGQKGFYQVNSETREADVEETGPRNQYSQKKFFSDSDGYGDSGQGSSVGGPASDGAGRRSLSSTVSSHPSNVREKETTSKHYQPEETALVASFQEIPDEENEKIVIDETLNNLTDVKPSADTRLPDTDVTDSPLVRDVKQAVVGVSYDIRSRSLLQDPQHTLSDPNHSPDSYVRFLHVKRPTGRTYKYIGKLIVNSGFQRNFNYSHPLYMQNDYCHPRYSEENIRLETFTSSNDRQRKGYETNELARVGWYFNGRAIQTFCCGMEMPQSPRGEPLDVHRGLSPQCSFALSLKSSVEFAYDKEVEQTEKRVRDLEVAGAAAELRFSVQCTEDPSSASAYGFPSDAFENGELDMFVGHQETQPGQQWESTEDYTMNFSIPVEDSSYREGLVTNRTPTAAEVWQPFTGVAGEEPDGHGQARPASFQQNSVTNAGRVSVREPGSQSSQGAMRLLRSLNENDNRRSPVNIEEQINFLGGPLGDGDRPRHHQFAFPSVRIWTYEGWPAEHPLSPAALVDAGLFYAGYGDCVLCFSCGIGIRHWLPMDNPWIEHARWRPSCFYVRSIQGPEFVEAALELTRNNRRPSYEEVRLEANNRRHRNAEQGADRDEVIPLPGDRERELNLLCKSCYTNEMCIVLMPCRHLALCTRCSGRVFACPICRARIESTFMARYD